MSAKWYVRDFPHSPRRFIALNAALLALGIALWYVNPGLQNVSTRIRPDAWGHFLSIYICSIAAGIFIVFAIMEFLACLLHLHDEKYLVSLSPDQHRANFWSPVIVGYVELTMYPLAIIWAHPEFIGAWLVIKVAGQWAGWQGTKDTTNGKHSLSISRWRYNRFIVGNALNIIAAVATYAIMKFNRVFT
jgi:hypothetical protein